MDGLKGNDGLKRNGGVKGEWMRIKGNEWVKREWRG